MIKSQIYRALGLILICSLTQSFITGISSVYFHPYGGKDTLTSYVYGIYVTFVYILIFGYWLFYLPGIAFYYLTVGYIKGKSYLYYISLGALIGTLCMIPGLMAESTLKWYSFPTQRSWFTLPSSLLVGAVYGYFYKRWFSEAIIDTDE